MDDDEDVEWGEDTSDAAVARRMKDLSDAAKNLALSEDIEETPQERIDMFYSYVKVTILVKAKESTYSGAQPQGGHGSCETWNNCL